MSNTDPTKGGHEARCSRRISSTCVLYSTDSLFIVMFKGSLVGERLLNQHNNFYLLFIIFYRIYQNINESKHFLNGVNGEQNLMHFPIQLLSVGVVEILRYPLSHTPMAN